MSSLVLDSIRLQRGGQIILNDVSWNIEPGEHWVILGANGSGKSSLLQVVAGIQHPTSGTMDLLGCRFGRGNWAKLRERIGLVHALLGEWIEPGECPVEILVGALHHQVNYWGKWSSEDEGAARQCIERLGLEECAERPWRFLSQGERQRVLLGRAQMAAFDLLILDEPCAGLDPVARRSFLQLVETVAHEDRGEGLPFLILVTHHLEEIPPAFSHVLALKEGKVVASGPKKKVLVPDVMEEVYGERFLVRREKGWHRLAWPEPV
ncbi:MAG: ATP-binding cassette domain-containing protein [Verrucomicrobiota bacterium]